MINDIENIQQLRLEILRRKTLSDTLMRDIKTDYKELKESLKPMNLAKNAFSNKTVATTAISSTALAGILFAARKMIMKKGKGLANSAVGLILPKIASAIASQAGQAIFAKLRGAINRQQEEMTK
jgi:hypothetical protein